MYLNTQAQTWSISSALSYLAAVEATSQCRNLMNWMRSNCATYISMTWALQKRHDMRLGTLLLITSKIVVVLCFLLPLTRLSIFSSIINRNFSPMLVTIKNPDYEQKCAKYNKNRRGFNASWNTKALLISDHQVYIQLPRRGRAAGEGLVAVEQQKMGRSP